MKISEFCIVFLEKLNPLEVVYKTMSHYYTAQELIEGLKNKEEEALRWATSVARVCVELVSCGSYSKSDAVEMMNFAEKINLPIFEKLLGELRDDEKNIVFFDGVATYNRNQMIFEIQHHTDIAMDYVCVFLSYVKKIILATK